MTAQTIREDSKDDLENSENDTRVTAKAIYGIHRGRIITNNQNNTGRQPKLHLGGSQSDPGALPTNIVGGHTKLHQGDSPNFFGGQQQLIRGTINTSYERQPKRSGGVQPKQSWGQPSRFPMGYPTLTVGDSQSDTGRQSQMALVLNDATT